ncbi:MAG: hypothetical protein AB7Q17_10190 [Phycisphaerae bacterium]
MTARPSARTVADAFGPPLTAEELTVNLTVLQNNLNRAMKCPAGKSQVYLRSLLTGRAATKPRISLKCSWRRDIGQQPEVYYEWIRDVCAGDPTQCEAYRKLHERFKHI